MSDRRCVIDMPTNARSNTGRMTLFMDGDTGTWRLFLENPENPVGQCVDLSLETLRVLTEKLRQVLMDIERQPDLFNAELRRSWERA